jgi:hypothetical protein
MMITAQASAAATKAVYLVFLVYLTARKTNAGD